MSTVAISSNFECVSREIQSDELTSEKVREVLTSTFEIYLENFNHESAANDFDLLVQNIVAADTESRTAIAERTELAHAFGVTVHIN